MRIFHRDNGLLYRLWIYTPISGDPSVIQGLTVIEIIMPIILQGGALFVLLFGIVAFAGFIFINEQHLKLKSIHSTMEKLSRGNLNLDNRLTIIGLDEIGLLTGSINTFIAKQQSLLGNILSISGTINSYVSDLENSVRNVKDAMEGNDSSIVMVRESVGIQNDKLEN